MPRLVDLGEASLFPEGGAVHTMIGSVPVAVFRLAGRLHALEDCCVHCGSPLSAGQVDGTTVRCPRCRWPYDVPSGSVITIPAIRLDTFPVRLEGEHVMVEAGAA